MNAVRYDPQVDVLYIQFADVPIEDSSEIESGVIVDYDEAGNIVGIEILDASKRIQAAKITRETVHSD